MTETTPDKEHAIVECVRCSTQWSGPGELPTRCPECLTPPSRGGGMTRAPYRLRLIDRLYRWAAHRFYPRSDGNVFVIGPECFADLDAEVICWQGANYYRTGRAETGATR